MMAKYMCDGCSLMSFVQPRGLKLGSGNSGIRINSSFSSPPNLSQANLGDTPPLSSYFLNLCFSKKKLYVGGKGFRNSWGKKEHHCTVEVKERPKGS